MSIRTSIKPTSTFASATALLAAMAFFAGTANAQSFADGLKRTVQRAAESEVQRRADRETRKVTRCAMGDDRCTSEAERCGDRVGMTGERGGVASADPGGDHPLITPYQGSQMHAREYSDYDEALRVVGNDNGVNRTQRLKGRVTRLSYSNPKGRSTFEITRNYRDALVARGLRVEYECVGMRPCAAFNVRTGVSLSDILAMKSASMSFSDVRYFTGKLRYGEGDAHVSIGVSPRYTMIQVIETSTMDSGMVGADAATLAAGLERDGKVTLEGIYFDTGRDTLKARSDPALDQVALLMRQQPELNLMVMGHTDSRGNADANIRLSQRRAERVRDTLVARHGVAAARLTAQGVGSSMPAASNATEAGRAQNRRVELVRR